MNYIAGYNAAGYLPEAELLETDSAHDAVEYIVETAIENGDLELHMHGPALQEGVKRLVQGKRAAFSLNGTEYFADAAQVTKNG